MEADCFAKGQPPWVMKKLVFRSVGSLKTGSSSSGF